jgi:hypothetical protein
MSSFFLKNLKLGILSLTIGYLATGHGGHESIPLEINARFTAPFNGFSLLQTSMIKLWVDQGIYFHDTAVAVLAGRPITEISANHARLLENCAAIGKLFGNFYGPSVETEITGLLQQQVAIGSNYWAALQSGNQALIQQTFNLWIAQSQLIANFLFSINSFFSLSTLTNLFSQEVTTEGLLSVYYFQHNYTTEIQLYDQLRAQLTEIGETLAIGIIRQLSHLGSSS